MAVSPSTTSSSRQSYRRQALIWLLMTLLLGVATALIWMFNQTPSMDAKIENAPISAPQALTVELEQPLAIEALHELDSDVQPISFDATIRDLRTYPDEFKDKRYLLANKGKWTVQVMNVAENDVIVSYLEGREDREKFAYFRYRNEENQLRYMLTYGLMSSPQEAAGASKLIDFNLPANVRVLPEEINRYVSIIDVYERSEPIKDLSNKRARSVNLRPTQREVPPRRQTAPTEVQTSRSSSNNTSPNTQAEVNNNDAQSIRQSVDTSETLSVSEERTITTEEQASTGSTPKSETSNKTPGSNSATSQKPPTVAKPKVPNSANGSNTSKPANGGSSTNTAKNSDDSLKELIQEKTN